MTNLELGALAKQYLDMKDCIAELESEAGMVKDRLVEALDPAQEKWEFPAALVFKVAGRKTVKVDPQVLRRELVMAGIPISTVETALAAATTETVGQPSVSIRRKKSE